jgi:hypothetical protein
MPKARREARAKRKSTLEHRRAFTFLRVAAVLIVGLLMASLEWDRALP